MSSLVLFDDVNVSLLPSGYDYYAGYVNGRYANVTEIRAKFPSARVLSIDVTGAAPTADCLDIEPGDAGNNTAVGWVRSKLAAGHKLIVLYTSASNINALVSTLTAAGISRSSYKLWSAHYGSGSHVCGPGTCKLTSHACDGTQFTSSALGKSLDESVLNDDFFGAVTPSVNPYPTISQGATGAAVQLLQQRLNAWGAKLTVDGDFGPATKAAVEAFQKAHKLTVDGIAGPQTWAVLKTNPVQPGAFAAPTGLACANATLDLWWRPVPAVGGKEPSGYHVEAVQQNGKVAVRTDVTGNTAQLKLIRGWAYEIRVWANGGAVAPPHASLNVTV